MTLGYFLGYVLRLLWCGHAWGRGLTLWRERRAVTAIEYALIASIMAFSILLGVKHIGQSLTVTFNSAASEL
jgi:pilus assembly protein Flp/PilA